MAKHPKNSIPVRAVLQDKTTKFGVIFVHQDQRIQDVMNDDRQFLPFSTREGSTLLNKAGIWQVDILSTDEIAERVEMFPEISLYYLRNNSW